MAILKCKMCGGDLEITEGKTVAECEYCGTQQTVPTADNEKKLTLFARANRLRFSCDFDKAAGVYESIVADFPEEAEAYWGLVLCKYGIEYVDDPATGKKIPTCHRSSFESVMDDSNFDQVMENADPIARNVYRDEAKTIEDLRKNIIEVSSKEDPYDIFICYKETDEQGDRTIDSVIAQDVYDALIEKGYRVFFSRITLEDKLGQEYEPFIFAALNSAKIMLAFGTCYDYYNAVWVKNEWSRFLQLIAQGDKKTLIPCFKNIDAYDMPKEFTRLQAQDMGKVGANQDLLRNIEKILPPPKKAPAETVVQSTSIAPLLKRVFLYLEDGDWGNADVYCEKVLDQDPENASAYLGKLMAELKVKKQEDLVNCTVPFDHLKNYQRAVRYADESLHRKLSDYASTVKERNRIASLDKIYVAALSDMRHAMAIPFGNTSNGSDIETPANRAITQFEQITDYKDSKQLIVQCKELIYQDGTALMNAARSEKQFQSAAAAFKSIPDYLSYKDCAKLISECQDKGEFARKDAIYLEAEKAAAVDLSRAIELYSSIPDHKDASDRAEACRIRQNEIAAANARRLAAEAAERERLEKQKKRRAFTKKLMKVLLKLAVIAAILIGICLLLPQIALLPIDESLNIVAALSLVLALVWAIYRKFIKKRGCIFPFIISLFLLFIGFAFVIGIAQSIFVHPVDDLYTPEIEQTYSGTYQNGDAILTIESTDDSGYLTGTFIFIVDGTYGKYEIDGRIIEKLNNNDITLEIYSGEWTFQPEGFETLSALQLEVSDNFETIEGELGFDLTAGESEHFISTRADLKKLSDSDNVYILTDDIDLSNSEWFTIHNFSGMLIGNGHTISGMTMEVSDSNVGFFSTLYGKVYDLNFENASVTVSGEAENVGIVCGSCEGMLFNVTADGEVIAEESTNVGGIAGLYSGETLQYLTNNASVTGGTYAGGIAGFLRAEDAVTLQELVNNGRITATVNYAGGLAGHVNQVCLFSNTIRLSNLSNTGELASPLVEGELIGRLESLSENTTYLSNVTTLGRYLAFGETFNTIVDVD